MDGTGKLFAPLLATLGAEVTSIVVQYPDWPLDYAGHVDVALRALPKDRPYILLGESFSGPIAISIAARSPVGLRGYILCSSFLTCPQAAGRLMRPWVALLSPQSAPEMVARYFPKGRFVTPELQRLHAEALNVVSPETLVARMKAIANVDARDDLMRVSVPGLFLRATDDRLVPSSAARAFAELAPNANVAEIEGPHLLLQSNPAAAIRVIRKFMCETAGTGDAIPQTSQQAPSL